MKEFFEDEKRHLSMNRLISFGCYLSGTVVSLFCIFNAIPEGIVAGCILAAVGAGAKALQKKYE